jgi:transcriptional regulator GlxA family with amidase domain
MTSSSQERHTLESLAALVGMSRSRFTYHFAATYGRSPMEFLQSIRLKRAAQLLEQRSLLVKSICSAVGFTSRSHFSRAFRAEYGIDPTAYRQKHASSEASPAAASGETNTYNDHELAKAAE